jgi:HSP20 family protein
MWDFFNESFFAPVLSDTHHFHTDIKDDGDDYVIEAELPSFEKDDIVVEYSNNYLMIFAKREADMKVEQENYIRQERYFVRHFYVEGIVDKAIDATLKNGILILKCPKLMLTNTDKKRIEIH